MECERCREDLTAYLDGELSESGAQEVRIHTEACRSCAAELESLRGSAEFFESGVQAVELSPALWHNVQARISAMEAPVPAGTLLNFFEAHRWATAAAAAVAVVVIAVGAWNFMRYEQSQRDLKRYMNTYIQQRESSNLAPEISTAAPNAISPVSYRGEESNPFLQVDSIPDRNPFRMEAQR